MKKTLMVLILVFIFAGCYTIADSVDSPRIHVDYGYGYYWGWSNQYYPHYYYPRYYNYMPLVRREWYRNLPPYKRVEPRYEPRRESGNTRRQGNRR